MRPEPDRSPKPRRMSTIAVAVTVTGILVSSATGVMILKTGYAKYRPDPAPRPHATASQLRVIMHQLGLNPEALAAVGATAQDVGTVVGDVATDLTTSFSAITDARDALARAKISKEALVRAVQSGQATPEQQQAYQTTLSTFRAAEADLQNLIDGVWSRATSGLTAAQREAVQTIRSNSSWGLSTEYLVVTRRESEWVRLRDAWSADRFARSRQEQTPPEAAAILDAAVQDPQVANAIRNLASSTAIQRAWDSAIALHSDIP